MRVWLKNWEWQCCGEPFDVGRKVVWDLLPADEGFRGWLATPLGADVAQGLTNFETHHGVNAKGQPTATRGQVVSIDAVYWEVAPRPGADERVKFPVPGTGALKPRERAAIWEPESDDGPRFAGYIVELAPLS